MEKRAAIYARVSTDDQADRGYSLPSQVEACRSMAERFGYKVAIEFKEDCSGAEPVNGRPLGRRLDEMIRRGQVEAVIVYQVDRLSRDIVDLLVTIRAWLAAGVEIYAGDVGQIESELDIVLVIKGWQGSDERKKIRERTMRGKRQKAREGRVVGGRAPYGYKHIKDANGKVVTFEPLEEEAQIVRMIYHWYVRGDENGRKLPAQAISKRLSELRIKTPGELQPGYKRKRESGMWTISAVFMIISNEVYAGVWRYGVRIGNTRNNYPVEEQITVSVPAIIERDLWEAAQKQRKANKLYSKRNARKRYLLSGLVKCGCECSLCGEYFSNHRYYSCSWRNNHHAGIEENPCKARAVRADALERDVWESVKRIFEDTAELERLLRIAQQEEISSMDPKREELQAVRGMIEDAEREAAEIARALQAAEGVVGRLMRDNMQAVNARYDALCTRLDDLNAELETMQLTNSAITQIVEYAEDVRAGMEYADFETQRYNLEALEVRVVVSQGRYYVSCLAGEWDGEITRLPAGIDTGGI